MSEKNDLCANRIYRATCSAQMTILKRLLNQISQYHNGVEGVSISSIEEWAKRERAKLEARLAE